MPVKIEKKGYKMKQLRIILLVFISIKIIAENVDLKLLATSGEYFTRTVDSNITNISFSKMDIPGHRSATIENLHLLENLNSIEFYNLPAINDYSFLSSLNKLEKLHFGGCTIYDLSFLESMKHLKYLYLSIRYPDELIDKKNITKINFSNLRNIEVIAYMPFPYTGVPKFYNVQNRPYLDITNNQIEYLLDTDLDLLTQYSLVSLNFNPIAKIKKPYEEYENTKLIFDYEFELPESILKYYR